MGACPTNDYAWQDLFDVGANYLNKFGDFTVALYGAFAYASFVPGFGPVGGVTPNVAANQVTGANLTAWKQWVVGAQFGFAGFTVGGAIGYDNNGLGSNYFTGVDNDTRFYTAGIMYETGPWQMSFLWTGAYNTNGNGSASVSSITPGTNAQVLNTASATGVPGVNSTYFNGNASTAANFGVSPRRSSNSAPTTRSDRASRRSAASCTTTSPAPQECRLRQQLGRHAGHGLALLVASEDRRSGRAGESPLFLLRGLAPARARRSVRPRC